MFTKLAVIITTSLIAFTSAAPGSGYDNGVTNTGITNSCNTGSFQCCESVHEGSSDVGQVLGALIGVNLQNVLGQVGLNCVAGNGIGAVSGANCQQNPVCCDRTIDDTLVGLGCVPITAQA